MPLESRLVHLFLEPGAVIAEVIGVYRMDPALRIVRGSELDWFTAIRTLRSLLVC